MRGWSVAVLSCKDKACSILKIKKKFLQTLRFCWPFAVGPTPSPSNFLHPGHVGSVGYVGYAFSSACRFTPARSILVMHTVLCKHTPLYRIGFVGYVGYAFSCACVFMRGQSVGHVGYVSTVLNPRRRFVACGRISVCITLLLHIIKL